jgi:hypothetical protein
MSTKAIKTFNLKKYAQNEWFINAAEKTKDPKLLMDIIREGKDKKDDWASECAIRNPHCPKEGFIEILRREKNDTISQLAAMNPNCPKEMLIEILRRERDDFVSRRAASNKNCPPEMLAEVLRRKKNDIVSRSCADNPNCPSYILVEILKRGKDDDVSQNAACNKNCPPEMLVEVLRRGLVNQVSIDASENPNCPLKYKIKWMQATNQIEKEDESKGHIIEYEDKRKEYDLSDLKKLLNNSNKNIKTSQLIKKLYSKQEMINAGADGYFSEAILLDIPVEKIIGREPIPASYVDEDGTERQFLDKRKIFVPIEVEYDDGQFVLYGGNHRLRQAEINGDKYIKAFVYCHDKNYKKLWNK